MDSQPMQSGESERVLVDAIRDVVRYFMRKTGRDVVQYGVSPSLFSPQALRTSFESPMNAEILAGSEPQESVLKWLLSTAGRGPVLFYFLWQPSSATQPHVAALELSFTRPTMLKVRLLWLALPEQVPVSPRVGVIDGREPLKEAVFAKLHVHEDGRLEEPRPPS